MIYYVYIVQCKDGSLYTGITPDIERRISQHNRGKGAKYTRGRGPVKLVYSCKCNDKSAALRTEILIKRFSRAEKLAMIKALE